MVKESKESREERAKSSTSPEELEKLAQDKEWGVRIEVDKNVNTPVSMLGSWLRMKMSMYANLLKKTSTRLLLR